MPSGAAWPHPPGSPPRTPRRATSRSTCALLRDRLRQHEIVTLHPRGFRGAQHRVDEILRPEYFLASKREVVVEVHGIDRVDRGAPYFRNVVMGGVRRGMLRR